MASRVWIFVYNFSLVLQIAQSSSSYHDEEISFEDRNGNYKYSLCQKSITNIRCEADEICRDFMGPTSRLARLENENRRYFINRTLTDLASSHNLSNSFWVFGTTNKQSSLLIDFSRHVLFDSQGSRCVILSRYNGRTGGMDNPHYNSYSKPCTNSHPLLCETFIGETRDAVQRSVVTYALAALLILALLYIAILAKKKGEFSAEGIQGSLDSLGLEPLPTIPITAIPSIYESNYDASLSSVANALDVGEVVLLSTHSVWRRADTLDIRSIPKGTNVLVKILAGSVVSPYEIRAFYDEIRALEQVGGSHYTPACLAKALYEESPMAILDLPAVGNLECYLGDRARSLYTTEDNVLTHSSGLMQQAKLTLMTDVLKLATEVVAALDFIHKSGMLFPSLVCTDVWIQEGMTCTLTGFMLPADARDKVLYDKLSQKCSCNKQGAWAPETVSSGRLTVESNLYQLATLLSTTFATVSDVDMGRDKICRNVTKCGGINCTAPCNRNLSRPTLCPVALYAELEKTWNILPEKRPSCTQIKTSLNNIRANVQLPPEVEEPIYIELA